MAGEIGYRSDPGVGTEFFVVVPRACGAGVLQHRTQQASES
jgi:hypothetical protein